MNKRVTLVEINMYDEMIPLVSGYLQAYACSDNIIRDNYEFIKYSTSVETSLDTIIESVLQNPSEVYAFSCYVWNISKMQKIISKLIEVNPDTYIILGGPHVMNEANKYLDPLNDRMIICNGEGEITFSNFLKACLYKNPDFSTIRGVSYYRDGTLITTPNEERIKDLNNIPSPYNSKIFNGSYRWSIIETNRGCPFHCSFCYWGAATNDRVYRFSDERVKQDLHWLSENAVPCIFIADANWGIFPRDITLSKYIVECKKKNKAPVVVQFSAAKNRTANVLEISGILRSAGLLGYSSISLQSLNPVTLEAVDRKNISMTAYKEMQEQLELKGINTYVELIWPLPGETLDSFQHGIEVLCEEGTPHIFVYPHSLLPNTPIYKDQNKLGLIVQEFEFSGEKTDIIVQTKEVSYQSFRDGCWFYFMVAALVNTQSFIMLRTYLHEKGLCSYSTFLSALAEHFQSQPEHHITKLFEQFINERGMSGTDTIPIVYELILHSQRNAFDLVLHQFVIEQAWWEDENTHLLFELGRLMKPCLFRDTQLKEQFIDFEFIKIFELSERIYIIDLPNKFLSLIPSYDEKKIHTGANTRFCISHNQGQIPNRYGLTAAKQAELISGALSMIQKNVPKLSICLDTSTQFKNNNLKSEKI